jgi:hypothetical protein
MNFLFTLLLCTLSVTFAAKEHTSDLSKSSSATPKDTSVGCLQKRDGMPLYRRGGGCSRPQYHPEVAELSEIFRERLGPMQLIKQNLADFAALQGASETIGSGEPPALPAIPAEPPREELEGAALKADEASCLAWDGYDEGYHGRKSEQLNVKLHGADEFGQADVQEELDIEHYTSNPNNVRYDSAYRHEMAPEDTPDLEGKELKCRKYYREGRDEIRRKIPTPKPNPFSTAKNFKLPNPKTVKKYNLPKPYSASLKKAPGQNF